MNELNVISPEKRQEALVYQDWVTSQLPNMVADSAYMQHIVGPYQLWSEYMNLSLNLDVVAGYVGTSARVLRYGLMYVEEPRQFGLRLEERLKRFASKEHVDLNGLIDAVYSLGRAVNNQYPNQTFEHFVPR